MTSTNLQELPRYDIARSYDWNYAHAPSPVETSVPPMGGAWDFCGLPVASPLGIAAGPLLNGAWLLYYASLGYDVLTYKTVRRTSRTCYPMPNLLPVRPRADEGERDGWRERLLADDRMHGSWAISFGMPSREPAVWTDDVRAARARLPEGKLLAVSVVATQDEAATLDDLAEDYAECARMAVSAGADAVEANFSCPNVSSADGQLYSAARSAGVVARRLREVVGTRPLVIKIGHQTDRRSAAELVDALAPFADALSMVNTVRATVVDGRGQAYFDAQPRGIGGAMIHDAAVRQVTLFADVIARAQARLRIVGVGGARTSADARRFVSAGAHAVHLATAAMVEPAAAINIRREWPT